MTQSDVILPPLLEKTTKLAAVTIGVFLLWSGFAKIDEAVKGNGRTISSGQNKVIQHMEGGIVSEILVQEGQIVDNNQPLFRIQNETNAAMLQDNTVHLHSLEASLIRLNAESEGKEPVFPQDMRQSMPDVVQNEERLFASRTQQRAESLRIFSDQIEQKQHALEEQNSKVINLKRELATAVEQYGITASLQKDGAASTNRMLDAKAKVDRFRTELSTITQTIPVTQAEMNEAKGRLGESKARQKNELLEELHKTTLESQQLSERLKADKDKMVRTEVLSPVKGIVNRLYIHTVGGTVRPSETLAEITPFDDNIIVEAKIAPEHRAKIWTGQDVKVKITAYEYAKYGTIAGKISDISADSFTDEQSKAAYYRVKVTLSGKGAFDNKKIMPGMMTEVNILTGKRTVLDYLLRPLIDIKEDAFKE